MDSLLQGRRSKRAPWRGFRAKAFDSPAFRLSLSLQTGAALQEGQLPDPPARDQGAPGGTAEIHTHIFYFFCVAIFCVSSFGNFTFIFLPYSTFAFFAYLGNELDRGKSVFFRSLFKNIGRFSSFFEPSVGIITCKSTKITLCSLFDAFILLRGNINTMRPCPGIEIPP